MINELEWQSEGLCKDLPTGIFFPGQGETVNKMAIDACEECPVKEQCLDHALRHEGYGYWGGTTEKERQRIRKVRKIRLKNPSTGMGNIGVGFNPNGRPRIEKPECGTMQGYNYEQRNGLPFCDACKAARAAYNKKRYQELKAAM